MSEATTCPRCSAPLPPGAGEDACPRCLLAAGLESLPPEVGTADAPAARTPVPTAPTPEEIGAHFPQFEVLELLGQGGMGIVYKVRQRNLDRLVALKVMPPEAARDAGFAERFTREARTLARLQHPNIVAIHDFGTSDGLYYLLMEFVDGANLRQAIRSGALTPSQALAIVPQICDALQYAHENGVVHRDVKPENILLDRAGRVRIADFGLAKIVQRTPVDVTLTRAGQVMGTLHYMAPEQVRTPDAVDHRADIYSLGVVFYEMLTGELPLGSFPPPSEKAGVDLRLDRVVMRALESERDRRWQSASDLKTRMSEIAAAPAPAPPAAAPAAAPDRPADAAAAAAPVDAKPVDAKPVAAARVSRLATCGGLGVPAAIAVALATTLVLKGLGAHDEADWLPSGAAGLVLFAGWIASMVAWARIHHAGGALGGKAWAVTGTFLPIVFTCCGGWFLIGVPKPLGISVKEGPDGRRVTMPFIDVQESSDGRTRVRMPGIDVEQDADEGGVWIRSSEVTAADRAAAGRVTGGPERLDEDGRASIVASLRRLWDVCGADARWGGRARLTPLERDGFRFFHLALDADGRTGRVVRTDGSRTLAIPVESDDGSLWTLCADERVEFVDRPANEDDRDGFLTR